MSNFAPIVDRIRIIPRPADFLERNSGNSGEVYFNRQTNSLRVYSGDDTGGFEIARADLNNVDAEVLRDKIGETSSGSDQTSVFVSDSAPLNADNGSIWFDTNNASLFLYYEDNDSQQWIQPSPTAFTSATELDFPANPSVNDTFSSNGITWQWNGFVWKITVSEILDQNAFTTIESQGQPSIVAASANDVLKFEAGDNVSLTFDSSTKTITISSLDQGTGSQTQNVFTDFNADTGSITASSANDFISIVGGLGITTSIVDNTLQIDPTNILISFNNNIEPANAGLTLDKIYESALITFRVNNVGVNAYTFQPHYDGENPQIYVLSGATVAFDLDQIGGHPFAIQDSVGNNLTEGLVHVAADGTVSTDGDAQGKQSGTLYWRIKETLFGTYRYQCLNHAGMVGPITIKRFSLI